MPRPHERKEVYALSTRDLLDARDAFHVHLAHFHNVVATAIGRFRYRTSDPGYADATRADVHQPSAAPKANRTRAAARTLQNSHVRPWSPPSVLVFVDRWLSPEEFPDQPNDIIPSFLYMPDGRVVPTCVILVHEQPVAPPPPEHLSFPSRLVGGGYVTVANVQGREHVGSIGCLVTDGDMTYALTNHHVTGPGGREISTMINGTLQKIGVSDAKHKGKIPFEQAYPGWPGTRAFTTLDAGLIRVDDVTHWTTQVFGIGQLDEPLDLNPDTITLDLIGKPVRAFGGASAELYGQIIALFYRYKSIGSFDYIADLLIGSREGEERMQTLPGDSGTLWVLDSDTSAAHDSAALRRKGKGAPPPEPLAAVPKRPLALQWGGHRLVDAGGTTEFHYGLATCLSTICRILDVDVVRDWNIGHAEYWGEMGHYTIGAKACDVVSEPGLRKLMHANVDRVGFVDAGLRNPKKYKMAEAHYSYVPLADVADNVWRNTRTYAPNDDGNNHFADMDQPAGPGPFEGKTLLDLCKSAKNVDVDVWLHFYSSIPGTNPGALPFRVWQIYNEMVRFLTAQGGPDIARFLCAAGCLAHYVGDACQPLHVSRLHHGFPPLKKGTVAYKVHSVYETDVLDLHAPQIVEGVKSRLQKVKAKPTLKGGHAAAVRVIGLMRQTVTAIKPETLVSTYNAGTSPNDRINRLWAAFGDDTMTCLANGSRCLAEIWESAWAEGGGSKIPASKLKGISKTLLASIYTPSDFLLSRPLKEMGPLLQ